MSTSISETAAAEAVISAAQSSSKKSGIFGSAFTAPDTSAAPAVVRYDSQSVIADMWRAVATDRIAINAEGPITNLAVALSRPYGVTSGQVERGAKVVVAVATAEFPPQARFPQAIKALKEIEKTNSALVQRWDEIQVTKVEDEYRHQLDTASEKLIVGQTHDFDTMESEQEIAKRFKNEQAAIERTQRKLGFQQIAHAKIIFEEIDAALAKLAASFDGRDSEDCTRLGVTLEAGFGGRLVHSVRVHFNKLTFTLLKDFPSITPETGIMPFARLMFCHFIDVSSW